MRNIYGLLIGIFLLASCQKNSIEQEQDLCKSAKSIPQITFIKLSNIFANKVDILGYKYKQDSIAVTLKYQDAEADLGTDVSKKIVNADGSRETIFVNIFKKNSDGTFIKLILQESINFSLIPVPTVSGKIITGENYPLRVTSFSSCSGEITFSLTFGFFSLNYIGLKIGDKIKFEFYIKDRAGNISNIAETSETTFSENP